MGLSGKKDVQVDIRCNRDVVYGLFKHRLNDLLYIAPQYYLGCELQEGEWGTVGAIFIQNYLLDGKKQFCKKCLEALDEVNRSITYKVCDGDLLKAYKSFKEHLRFDGKGDNNCTFTWTLEYEKMNEDVPDPDSVFEAVQSIIKYAETHIVESAQDK
ncbi:kirola [Artemisia annua]|uniref:Kirola n=1 Tax=Artemisia annua TaxID=35608 RepID=A0A2U1KXD9_ARTAN|nr:kirola [Artemisia annua]